MKTRDKPLISTLPTALVLLALAWAPPGLAQEPHPFSGFTVMEIGNDAIHGAVGLNPGFPDGNITVLLTMIAGNQSYASITRGGYGRFFPDCVTWIGQEEETPDQFVLGDGDGWRFREVYSVNTTEPPHGRAANPSGVVVCAEFRLQRLGPKQVLFVKGDLRVVLPIVANYPILSIDWSDPSLSRFRINGYGLGRVTEDDIPKMYARPEPGRTAIEQPAMGRLKRLRIRSEADSGRVSVQALADVDRLISEGQAEIVWLTYSQLTQVPFGKPGRATNLGLTETFYETMLGRYGTPSAVFDGPPGSNGPIWIWAHDLHGRFLSKEEDSNDPCLKRLLEHQIGQHLPPVEAGIWKCGLVMTLDRVWLRGPAANDPSTARVVQYQIELFHGHAMAHHYFSDRLELVKAVRGAIPDRREQPSDTVSPPPVQEERRGRRGS